MGTLDYVQPPVMFRDGVVKQPILISTYGRSCCQPKRPSQGFYTISDGEYSATPRSSNESLVSLPSSAHSCISNSTRLSSPASYAGVAMERTPSGETIVDDLSFLSETSGTYTFVSTESAALEVKKHLHRRRRRLHHFSERMYEHRLRRLITSQKHLNDFELDELADAVNCVFFNNKLDGRVRWEWSDQSQSKYDVELIGTTAFRASRHGGIETLIILSRPLLQENYDYSPLLLISTFIHELIHSYLFVSCGKAAKQDGGHPKAFHQIARFIDKWEMERVGQSGLKLCDIGADLKRFKTSWTIPPSQSDAIDDPARSFPAYDTFDDTHERSSKRLKTVEPRSSVQFFSSALYTQYEYGPPSVAFGCTPTYVPHR